MMIGLAASPAPGCPSGFQLSVEGICVPPGQNPLIPGCAAFPSGCIVDEILYAGNDAPGVPAQPICGLSSDFPDGHVDPSSKMVTMCTGYNPAALGLSCSVPQSMAATYKCPNATSAPVSHSSYSYPSNPPVTPPVSTTTVGSGSGGGMIPVGPSTSPAPQPVASSSSASAPAGSPDWLLLAAAAVAAFFVLGGAK